MGRQKWFINLNPCLFWIRWMRGRDLRNTLFINSLSSVFSSSCPLLFIFLTPYFFPSSLPGPSILLLLFHSSLFLIPPFLSYTLFSTLSFFPNLRPTRSLFLSSQADKLLSGVDRQILLFSATFKLTAYSVSMAYSTF